MSEDIVYADIKLAGKNVSPSRPSAPSPSQDATSPVTDSHPSSKCHRTLLKVAYTVIVILLMVMIALSVLVFKQIDSMACSKPGAGNPNRSAICAGTSTVGSTPSTVVPTLRTCPEDWQLHQGKCYWFSNGSRIRTWNDSDADCEARKSNLTVIRDMCELGFIWSKIPQSCKYWIRLPIQNAEGNWTWSNDSVLNWSLFKDNNPTNEKNEGQENKQCEMDPHRDQQNKKLKENKRAQENPKNERKKKQANKYHEKHKPSDKKNQCPVLSWGKIGLDSCDNANFWLCQQ
uniref:C-type lectin domain-containing protein n=1 Tax=Ornithorhynchus anatinus TaxID=9258 RepID=A0A6I8NA18_ORNAN